MWKASLVASDETSPGGGYDSNDEVLMALRLMPFLLARRVLYYTGGAQTAQPSIKAINHPLATPPFANEGDESGISAAIRLGQRSMP